MVNFTMFLYYSMAKRTWSLQRRTYLTADEFHSEVRGTEFQRYKQRILLVLAVNGDRSHMFPVNYIGKSENPMFLRDPRCSYLHGYYWHQSNGWMDSCGFDRWIRWWYTEVQKVSDGPWLLILDSCGGHESEIVLPNVRIEFLPLGTTAKYQTFDLGLIANSKIRYRSLLLRVTLDIFERRMAGNHQFKESFGRGNLEMREGQLPHVADVMQMFNEAWRMTSRTSVLRCWVESQCFSTTQILQARSILQQLTNESEPILDLVNTGNGHTNNQELFIVDSGTTRDVYSSLNAMRLQNVPQTPLLEVIDDTQDISDESLLLHILNSPAP